ncbi:helix-turn-helix transcriptional regulator [Amycolatopsis sacchari]|uniref:helix-turn-helix transcriptional regulator n=1 Tax=Amycolatopsis sacchari TaxID=115433 RepID=UPI003D74129F
MDRKGLADFLRTRRAKLQPRDVGLPAGLRRRTPGLRREEVAGLAAISTDYYTRLEQARGPQPSRQVLTGIGRALRLSDEERAHLFHLAGEVPDLPPGPSREVTPGLLHLIDRLDDAVAYVTDIAFDVLAWNPLASALMGDLTRFGRRERNLARRHFLPQPDDGFRWYHSDFGRTAVGRLRTAAAKYPDDTYVRELVDELRAGSDEFAELWSRHDVVAHPAHRRKALWHPLVGEFEVDCEVLLVSERDQQLVLFTTEPGTSGHEALQLLKVVGTQDLGQVSH